MTITTDSLPEAPVAVAYKAALTRSGGKGTVSFAIISGALPPGVILSTAGAFSGTPTTTGTYPFTVKASDSATPKNTATKSFSITVTPMTITTSSLPGAPVAAAYKAVLTRSGGKPTVTYVVSAGSLPPGITMASTGVFGGTPSTLGTYPFTVKLSDASTPKRTTTKSFSITVTPMTITTSSLPDAPVAVAYKGALTRSGGKTTVTYTITSGALPPGITLSTGGALGGTPTTTGTYPFTVRLTDSSTPKNTATKALSITVTPMTITTSSLPYATLAVAYKAAIAHSGGKATVKFVVSSGSLPPGITMSTAGALAGTPTKLGAYPFTVTLTDASTPKKSATQDLVLTVVRAGHTENLFTSVTTGLNHSCGIKVGGTVWCWGDGSWGQLGNNAAGEAYSSSVPTQIGTQSDWASLGSGWFFTCGLKTDGSAWCWGDNSYGQLGNADNMGTPNDGIRHANPVPAKVGTSNDWIALAVGDHHVCGLKENGTAWCWGYNSFGELGNSTNILVIAPNPVPSQVGSDSDWKSLTAGGYHTCGLKQNGTAWCWGSNRLGQLGNTATVGGSDAHYRVPVPAQVGSGNDWSSLSAGEEHTCGVKTNGTAWCWGDNELGRLGNSTNAELVEYPNRSTPNPNPAQVGSDTDWAAVTAGAGHTCGIKSNGTAWCWGANYYGELGSASGNEALDPHPDPMAVGSGSTWAVLAPGSSFTCGVKSNGTGWCWGFNHDGQLGHNGNVGQLEPNPTPIRVTA